MKKRGALRLSAAPTAPVRFLWKGYLPVGRLVLLDALPGTGKTTAVCSLLGQATREGGLWPDGTPVERPLTAVMLAHEDDPGTLRTRVEAAGGDASRVILWERNAAGLLPRLPADLAELTEMLKEHRADLLVLDPVASAFDTSGGDTKTRDRLADLLAVCAELGVTVLGLRHPTKQGASGRGPALYRAGGGSVAIPALSRAAFLLAADPGVPGQLVFAGTKASLTKMPGSLSCRIMQAENGAPRMEWLGASPLDAEQLLDAAANGGALAEAMRWLQGLLRNGRPMAVSMIRQLGLADGISWRTLERAKSAANVTSRRSGTGWVWQLAEEKSASSRA